MNTLEDYTIVDNDVDAWNKYPRYNWMYNMSRLLDAQNVAWSPFRTKDLDVGLPTFTIDRSDIVFSRLDQTWLNKTMAGTVFISPVEGRKIHTETLIRKGSLKWFKHFNPTSHNFYDDTIGEVELRINAFVTLYFKKFNGAVSFETVGNQIISIKLYPTKELLSQYPPEVITQLKKILPKK